MQSAASEERPTRKVADGLALALVRVAVLAPGGFIVGYLLGRSLGVLVSGCPLWGPCDELLSVLVAIPTSIIGMGLGCTLASMRVRRWLEGVGVWGGGIGATIVMLSLFGWLGSDSPQGRTLALTWALAAIGWSMVYWLRRTAR